MGKPGKGHNKKAVLVEAEIIEADIINDKKELVETKLRDKELQDKLRENGEKWGTLGEKRWDTIEDLDNVRLKWLKRINEMEANEQQATQDYMLALTGAERAATAEAKAIDAAIKHLFYQPEQIKSDQSNEFVIRIEAVKDE